VIIFSSFAHSLPTNAGKPPEYFETARFRHSRISEISCAQHVVVIALHQRITKIRAHSQYPKIVTFDPNG